MNGLSPREVFDLEEKYRSSTRELRELQAHDEQCQTILQNLREIIRPRREESLLDAVRRLLGEMSEELQQGRRAAGDIVKQRDDCLQTLREQEDLIKHLTGKSNVEAERIGALQNEITRAKKERDEVILQNQDKTNHLHALRDEMQRLESDHAKQIRVCNDLNKTSKAENLRLTQETTSKMQQVQSLSNEIKALNEQMTRLVMDNQKLQKDVQGLNAERADLTGEIQKLNREYPRRLAQLNEQVGTLTRESQADGQRIKQYEAEFAALTSQFDGLRAQGNVQTQELQGLRTTAKTQEAIIQDLQTKLGQANSATNAKERDLEMEKVKLALYEQQAKETEGMLREQLTKAIDEQETLRKQKGILQQEFEKAIDMSIKNKAEVEALMQIEARFPTDVKPENVLAMLDHAIEIARPLAAKMDKVPHFVSVISALEKSTIRIKLLENFAEEFIKGNTNPEHYTKAYQILDILSRYSDHFELQPRRRLKTAWTSHSLPIVSTNDIQAILRELKLMKIESDLVTGVLAAYFPFRSRW